MEWIESFVFPVLRVSSPLILAALGGLWCERSGVIQIGLEGMMLVGAFFGAVAALSFQNVMIGFLFAALAGILLSALYGLIVIEFKGNQIVSGTGINLLALGIPPFVSKILYDSTGGTPPLSSELQKSGLPILIIFISCILSIVLYHYSRFGLHLRFAGEHPKALLASGHSVRFKRWQGVLLSGFFAGLGGALLSLWLSSSFIRNMAGGRGFIALAAVILGKWKPIPTLIACLFFGFTEAAQIRLQGVVLWGTEPVPVQWIQVLPYAMTIFVLAFAVGRSSAPKGLGQE